MSELVFLPDGVSPAPCGWGDGVKTPRENIADNIEWLYCTYHPVTFVLPSKIQLRFARQVMTKRGYRRWRGKWRDSQIKAAVL